MNCNECYFVKFSKFNISDNEKIDILLKEVQFLKEKLHQYKLENKKLKKDTNVKNKYSLLEGVK